MIVIIEGCDRTGKSTLAAKIAEAIKGEVIHCGKPKTDDPYSEYLGMLAELPSYKNFVFDRFYLGEYVYSQLWRNGCAITPREFHSLDVIASSLHRAIVIHAYADQQIILDRCAKEGEDLLKPVEIQRCQELFNDIINHTNLPVISYDSGNQSPDDIVKIVKAYAPR
jgi:thymidylate kinase